MDSIQDKKVKNIKKLDLIFITIFVIAYIICIKNLILFGKPIGYDDPILIEPMLKVNNLKDYLSLINQNIIWDVQPIRDLSYFIDIQLMKLIPFWNFHITNLIIWALISITLYHFFKEFLSHFAKINKQWIYLITLYFFLNPVFQIGPFWLSSRKHILSTFFALLAGYITVKFKNTILKNYKYTCLIILFYFLSIFSHPITLMLPVFIILFIFNLKSPKEWISPQALFLFLGLLVISIWGAYENYYFYNEKYPLMNNGSSYKLTSDNLLQVRLLTLGRFFYQIFDFSFSSPVEHDRGSIRNIIGLLTLPIFIYLSLKMNKFKSTFFSILWFILPITIVIFGDVKLFALDTYLLTASFGILSIILLFLFRIKFQFMYYLLLVPLFFDLRTYADAFLDNYELAKYATRKELSTFSQYSLTLSLISRGNYNEAFKEAYALSRLAPNFPDLNYLLPISLFGATQISRTNKIKIFEKWNNNNFFATYFHSLLYLNNSQKFRTLQDLAIQQAPAALKFKDVKDITMASLAAYEFYCEPNKKTFCKSQIDEIKKLSPINYWDDKKYFYNKFDLYRKNSQLTPIDKDRFNLDLLMKNKYLNMTLR